MSNALLRLTSIFISPLLLIATQAFSLGIDVNQKNPTDTREFRTITLSNQLEALLISDPSFNKSAAAIDIAVGSYEDPSTSLGMAHYLEHVLFLGTKTYPEPDEFAAYLEANQGDWNAYTASESTNYHFDINHSAFEGALKRFSLFFSEPTFNPEYFPKERQAVHSEFKKNLDSDYSRYYAVFQNLMNKDHPASRFSIGNLDTLGKSGVAEMKSFFEKYYSANVMKLVLLSNLPLDKIESMAKTYFSPIKNFNRKAIDYSTEYLNTKLLPAEIHIEPIKDQKSLEIGFPLPSMYSFWKTKPHEILSHLLGHEGKGSLLSKLKKMGLATGIYTSVPTSSYASTFETTISLTEKGMKDVDSVISVFFQYIKLSKSLGYQKYIFDEEKTMREINLFYKDKSEGIDIASAYAGLMQKMPAMEIEKRPYLIYAYGEKEFSDLIKLIVPERMWITISAKNVTTNQEEPYFKAKYSIGKISKSRIDRYSKVTLDTDLTYPQMNQYIPKQLALLSQGKQSPHKIVDSDLGKFWFQPDDEFKLPKASLAVNILTDRVNASPRQKMLSNLYVVSLQRALEEWKYPITLAGLNFGISRIDRGIRLDFSGYSENIPMLVEKVTENLLKLDIDEAAFREIKEDLKRAIANSYLSDAYQQAIYQLAFLTDRLTIHPRTFYNINAGEKQIDLITPVKFNEVKEYARTIYQEIALEGVGYGNLRGADLAAVIEKIPGILGSKVLEKARRIEAKSIKLAPGENFASTLRSKVNNTAWVTNFQFGERNPELHAALEVGNSFLKANFFRSLRTQQQLGYIVSSWVSEAKKVLGMTFLIQSDQYPPDELAARSKNWMKDALISLKKLPEEDFVAAKAAVAAEYREKDKTISARLSRLYQEALILDGNFKYKESVAKAAEALTKDTLVNTFERAFSNKTSASLSIYLSTGTTPAFAPSERLINDDIEFKSKAEYF